MKKPTKLTLEITKAIDRYHKRHPHMRVSSILKSLEDLHHCLTEAMVKPKKKTWRDHNHGF